MMQIFVFILGLCIGSFLNCVIYRIEAEKSLKGRSFCPKCKHALSWKDLFPVFSFLFLRAKCRYCKAKIAWQYPLVEISTAAIFPLIFNFQFSIFTEFSIFQLINLLFYFYITSVLIVIFVYDLKHYLIPDKVLAPAIFLALGFRILNLFRISDFGFRISAPFWNYFLAVAVGAGFFLIIFLVSRGAWIGFGDVKLAVLMGLILGLPNILVALFLAFFIGAIAGIILLMRGKKNMKSQMPFGPFLVAGTFLAMFWGENILNWYYAWFYFN